ncbi:MAG: GGDEF domain-containing phosphodiesterase [Lachnospiraceae bacterium]|nr:GGDEF domain-containing phosphodiesterase [Lachnospiraceae bacterium]
MDKASESRYLKLFEQMVDMLNDPEHFNREALRGLLAELCEIFHVAKGVTEFYKSLSDERAGNGECLCDFDNGHGDKVALYRRYVTRTQAVVISTVYIAEEDPLFTDDEYEKVDLIMRSLQSFISRNRLQGTVEKLVFYDDNGHPNINYFLKSMDALNEQGVLLGKLVSEINLKHFSLVNQEIGREAGDLVIRNYLTDFQEFLANDGLICHVGGDTFILYFTYDRLDDFISFVNGHNTVYDTENDKKVLVTAYAGIYTIPDDFVYDRPGEILTRVISALGEAKMEQNGTIVFFSEESMLVKKHAMRIHREFAYALEQDEFKVFYQPKVNVFTGEMVGAEALCRWFHRGAIVAPQDFISILEENSDICTLDFKMLDTVCRDIRKWIDAGKPVVRTSVNLSRRHLVDMDLLDHILRIVDEHNVPHEYIEIELTETTTDVEFRDLKRVSAGLQQAGIRTSVDDFGMGYSSLNLIREVPWSVLKIDRCFLPEAGAKDDDITSLMYSYVVSMAHSIGLECVTEGVETLEQIGILKKNNCKIAQGYFFDRPLPVAEFEKRLETRHYTVPDENTPEVCA